MTLKRKRVRVLLLGWLLVGALGAARLSAAQQYQDLLDTYQARPAANWLALGGGLTLLLALLSVLSVLLRWRAAPWLNRAAALALAAAGWLERLLFWQSPSTGNGLFMAGLTVLLLGAVFWMTGVRDESKRSGD